MRAWVLFTSLILPCAACGASADTASLGSVGGSAGTSGGTASDAGEAGAPASPDSLEFEMAGELVARQELTLTIRALPPAPYRLRFALPTSADFTPLDAALSATEVDTDEDGIARVNLIAPSAKTTFAVRASADGTSPVHLVLQVIDTGFADVRVAPRYSSAVRFPTTWIATAHPGISCADLEGIPPPDGSFVSPPAAQSESPLLTGVPAQTPLAITLRSGHFVGGCASVAGLLPDAKEVVTVPVLNRPIDLGASHLSLKLELAETDTAWAPLLAAASDSALAALSGTSVDDVDALLDAMREASGNDRQLFEDARQSEGWDDVVRAQLGAQAATQLHSWVSGWLTQAQKSFFSSARLLEGVVEPDAEGSASAHLNVVTVAGVAAERAGVASPAIWSWSASPDDNVTMGTDLYLIESKLVTSLAEISAVAAWDEATDAPSALAQAVGCSSLGPALAAPGTPGLGYLGCDGACLQLLCRKALRSVWLRAVSATALAPSRLTLTATADAFVGDAAEVAGMNGSWLGQLQGPMGQLRPTRGSLTAASKP